MITNLLASRRKTWLLLLRQCSCTFQSYTYHLWKLVCIVLQISFIFLRFFLETNVGRWFIVNHLTSKYLCSIWKATHYWCNLVYFGGFKTIFGCYECLQLKINVRKTGFDAWWHFLTYLVKQVFEYLQLSEYAMLCFV